MAWWKKCKFFAASKSNVILAPSDRSHIGTDTWRNENKQTTKQPQTVHVNRRVSTGRATRASRDDDDVDHIINRTRFNDLFIPDDDVDADADGRWTHRAR